MPIPQELKLVLEAGVLRNRVLAKILRYTMDIRSRCDEFSATASHLNLLRHPTPAVLRNARKIRLATATNQTDKRLNPQILLHIGM
jgi:hypothetical protein